MSEPLVSIVLTLYNNERFIAETIQSVLSQSYTNWELIVVDDASADGSADIVLRFADPRIRLIRNEKNGQVSNAHNVGDRACRGEYIAPLDSDDLWDPAKLEKQVRYMEAHPETGACLTLLKTINEWGEETEDSEIAEIFRAENRSREAWLRELLTTGNHLANDSALIRRNVMEETGENDVCLVQLHDYDIWVRMLLKHNIYVIQEPLLLYRRFEKSGSLSAASETNRRRLYFEYSYVIGRTVREMDGELFRRVFGGDMRNPEAETEAELLCEKAILLAGDTLLCTEKADAFELFEIIFHDPELSAVMEEKYGMTQHDVYRMTGKKVYHDWTTDAEIHRLNAEIGARDAEIGVRDNEIEQLNAKLASMTASYHQAASDFQAITNSFFWRMTGPARRAVIVVKEKTKNRERLYTATRVTKALLRQGPKGASRRYRELKATAEIRVQRQMGYYVTSGQARKRRKLSFDRDILFSILVPLYNTPKQYLTEMLDSVRAQTYKKWELCLADGSDAEHGYVEEICRKYAARDHRIRYTKLEKNGGISENTNACLRMAKGDYLCLFDHDDLLHPFALTEYMKAICGRDADFLYSDENTFHETPMDAYFPHYKPDFAPDTLRSYNYICHFTVFSRELLEKAGGGFRKEFDGSQDYDLILRLTEKAEHIVHIPMILYYWRSHSDSTAADIGAKPYTIAAAKAALGEHLQRVGLKGKVKDSSLISTYKIQYEIEGTPLISILIPNMDHINDLRKCLDSIRTKSTWINWEAVIIENNSRETETFIYYKELERDPRIRVIRYGEGKEFNYSAINNFGAKEARGDYLLLLNNDIEIITPDWMEQMLMFAQRKDVGAVGAMLYYPDDTVQHAGVIIGVGGVAGHSHKYFPRGSGGYVSRMTIAQNYSAVTAACMMMSKAVWDQVGGLDENYAVAFNDVDLCMRIREAGYLIVWTPYAEMYHYESKSRGEEDSEEKQIRFKGEIDRFTERWKEILETGDPYYNPNLTLSREDFSFRDD